MDLKNTRYVKKKYYWQYDNTNQEIHADVCTSSWKLGALSRSGKSGRGSARDSLAILQQAYWNLSLSFYVWNYSRPLWRLVDTVVDLPTIIRNAKCELVIMLRSLQDLVQTPLSILQESLIKSLQRCSELHLLPWQLRVSFPCNT